MPIISRIRARPRWATRERVSLAAAVALYALAAAAGTWSALGSASTRFIAAVPEPGVESIEAEPGDHLQSIYRFWLVGHQLSQGNAPWQDPYSFQPLVDGQVVLGGWPFGPIWWPLEAVLGAALAWNVLLLATVVAAGLLTRAWLRALGIDEAGALLGGLAFALAPHRLAQSGGHLLGWIALFLPLALLSLERAASARSRASGHVWGALAALALLSVPLSGQVHLALAALPLVLAYALVRCGRREIAWAAAGCAVAAGVGLAIRSTLIEHSLEASQRSLAQVAVFSADLVDLVDRTQRYGSEKLVFSGYLVPLLALLGLGLLLRERRHGLAVLLGAAALLPLLLALGTNTPLYGWLWELLPPLRFPRVPGRLLPVASLAFAALAAAGTAGILSRFGGGRQRVAAAACLLVLVAADLSVQPLRAAKADPGNGAYRVLPRLAGGGPVLELPLFHPGTHYASVYLYYGTQQPLRRLGGYSTLAPAQVFDFTRQEDRLSCGIWLAGDRERLERLGVRAVVYHRGLYLQAPDEQGWFAWRGLIDAGYRPLARSGEITVLRRADGPPVLAPLAEPPRTAVAPCAGWREGRLARSQGALWAYGSGTLELRLEADSQIVARLWLDGVAERSHRLQGRRTLALRLDGERWHSLLVQAEPPSTLVLRSARVFR